MTYNTPASDLDLCIRAYLMGWQLLYFPHIEVPTRVSPSYARLRRKLYSQAAGQVALWRHYGGARAPPALNTRCQLEARHSADACQRQAAEPRAGAPPPPQAPSGRRATSAWAPGGARE